MKLEELISHRPYVKNVATRNEVQKKLHELGFKKIGEPSGYAGVYEHPNLSYALKVFDANDRGYRAFLQVVAQHPNNPHFPKFRGKPMVIVKSDDDTPKVMAIRMEKLKKLGFKKIKTEPGFHMYELTPARLNSFDSNFKKQATSRKQQAASFKLQAAKLLVASLKRQATSVKLQAASNKLQDTRTFIKFWHRVASV